MVEEAMPGQLEEREREVEVVKFVRKAEETVHHRTVEVWCPAQQIP